MRNFYHSCKLCTLTINFSEVWSRQILLWITVFAVRLRKVLNTSRRLVEYVSTNDLTLWYVLKTSWRDLCKTSWRRLEDIFKTSRRDLEDVLKTFCKTSWKGFEEVLIWNLIRVLQIPRPANSLGQLGSPQVFYKISPSPGFLPIFLIFQFIWFYL